MGKRFVPVRDADRRALELYFMLKEVEQLPLVGVRVHNDRKEPIVIWDKDDPTEKWWTYTVDQFLAIDLEAAKAKGSTWLALKLSRKKPARPAIPQPEVDRAVENFMLGREDDG